jgi:nickel/cobalt exporter
LLILGALLVLVAMALPALSHPLGNFSIDHYSRLRVTRHDLRLRYVIDMAEIPTFQALLEADVDRDRQLSPSERQAYLEHAGKSLAAGLTATLNGASLSWQVESSNLTAPSSLVQSSPGSGIATLRIVLDLRAEHATPLTTANTVRYADRNYQGRAGWKEIVVEGDGEVRLLRSSASRKDLSGEITRYPASVSAPPQDLSAEFTFDNGAGSGWTEAFRSRFREEHYLWLIAIVAGAGLFARWRSGRPHSGAG